MDMNFSVEKNSTNDDRVYWNEAMETLPWSEVEGWQLTQIAKAVPKIRQHSAMYSRYFSEVPTSLNFKEFSDLEILPFTTKDLIRRAQDEADADQPFGQNQAVPTSEIQQVLSSSGTTGRPMYYALTKADAEIFADAIANTWYTAGLRKNDIVAHLVGLPMVAGGLPYADGFRRVGATLCWLGGFPTDRILREMRRLRVSALLATTSFGLYLAEQWDAVGKETGIPSALKKVFCGGEPGLNQLEIRDRITNGLDIEQLREVMGLGDVISAMWSECQEHDGMHFNAQKYVAIELINPETGKQIPWVEGATGEIVYTAFARDATPLVRYRSRDHALVTGVKCSCGRTSPKIRCIGRTDDMMIYKGMNVFPTAIRDLITAEFSTQVEPSMRIWKDHADQVRFDDPISIDVETIEGFDPKTSESLSKAIEAEVRSQLQVRVDVCIVPFGTLPRNTYKNALIAVRDVVKS